LAYAAASIDLYVTVELKLSAKHNLNLCIVCSATLSILLDETTDLPGLAVIGKIDDREDEILSLPEISDVTTYLSTFTE